MPWPKKGKHGKCNYLVSSLSISIKRPPPLVTWNVYFPAQQGRAYSFSHGAKLWEFLVFPTHNIPTPNSHGSRKSCLFPLSYCFLKFGSTAYLNTTRIYVPRCRTMYLPLPLQLGFLLLSLFSLPFSVINQWFFIKDS